MQSFTYYTQNPLLQTYTKFINNYKHFFKQSLATPLASDDMGRMSLTYTFHSHMDHSSTSQT